MKKQKSFFATAAVLLSAVVLTGPAGAEDQSTSGAPSDPAWRHERLFRGDVNLAAQARKREAEGDYAEAAKVYEKMAKRATREASRVFALKRRAENLLQAEKYRPAYLAYRKLGEEYPQQVDVREINHRLRQIAEAHVKGETAFFGGPRLGQAREIYKLILVFAPAGDKAPADTMRLAGLQKQDGLPLKAMVTYREVLQKFPAADEAAYARLALAELYVEQARETRDRWEPARNAQQTVERFFQQHPDHAASNRAEALAQAADEVLARDLLYLGRFYMRPAHYRPGVSRRYLSDLIREYGHTSAAVQARALLAQLEGEPVPDAMPDAPDAEEVTPEKLLAERRRLPEPPDTGEEIDEAGRGTKRPEAPQLIEERERVKKWLRPIPDLGIESEE